MKKNIKSFIFLLVFIICLIYSSYTSQALSSAPTTPSSNQIEISFVCSEKNFDFTNIKVDIYRAELSYSDEANFYYEYNELYEKTLSVNKNGKVIFTRPTEYCSITVQLDSLPYFYGVNRYSKFFTEEDNMLQIQIEKIDSVNIEKDYNNYVPVLKDKYSFNLFANTTLTETDAVSYTEDAENKTININHEYIVELYQKKYSFTQPTTVAYTSPRERAEILFKNKLMTESDYLEQTSHQSNLTTDLESVENLIDRSSTYFVSSNGHFRVYYNSATTSANVASCIAEEFILVDNLLCGTWGLSQPFYTSDTSHYKIFIEPSNNNTPFAQTNSYGTNGSYITIYSNTANNIYNQVSPIPNSYLYSNAHKGVLAHEYFHAILMTYGIQYTENDLKWLHESMACLAGSIYEDDYNALNSTNVNVFLSTPNITLTHPAQSTDSRYYGSMLFPLYLYKHVGNRYIIKQIIDKVSNGQSPLTAIDQALTTYNSSLKDAFVEFATYIYDIDYFYQINTFDTYGWTQNNVNNRNVSYTSPNVTLSGLSANYDKYQAPSTNSTFTVSISSNSSPNIFSVNAIRGAADGTYYIRDNIPQNNGKYTIVQGNFGANNATTLGVVPVNTSLNSNISFSSIASLSNENIRIYLDAQGGACSVDSIVTAPGSTYGNLPIPQKTGYTFVGWWLSPTQEHREITSNSTVEQSTNHTLYAHWAKTYKITNVGAEKCLNIYGDNVTSLTSNTNVTLWSDSGTNEQKWLISTIGTNIYIRSVIDQNFGLNVYRAGSPYNCDVYRIIGNETDASVQILETANGCIIRLTNYDLYLTANSSINGANVYWSSFTGSDYQYWRLSQLN